MLKSDILDFVKVVIRFESLGVWDFGLEKSKMYFCFRTKEKEKDIFKLIIYEVSYFFLILCYNS